jgi:Mrp family chromosome partitioning ATPase
MAATVFSALAHTRDDDGRTQSVAVVSSAPGAGRTSLVARLGVAAALEGRDTMLIDFDLLNPELHNEFRIANGFGITYVLWSAATKPRPISEASIEVMDHLRVIPCGQHVSMSTMRFNGADIAAAVNPLKGNGTDLLFFDTSPMSQGGDAVLLGEILDAAIIVVEARKTTTDTLSSLTSQMEALGLSVLGYILNKQ